MQVNACAANIRSIVRPEELGDLKLPPSARAATGLFAALCGSVST